MTPTQFEARLLRIVEETVPRKSWWERWLARRLAAAEYRRIVKQHRQVESVAQTRVLDV